MIGVGMLIGFILQVLLGNICMMPMTYAMEKTMPDAMEMVMTPVIPMSPLHCEDCIAVQEQSGELQGQGCTGHCLVQAKSTAVGLASVHTSVIAVNALSNTIPFLEEVVLSVGSLAMGPPIALHIDTTVLRL